MADQHSVELPELLGRYFWDYAPGGLSWPADRYMIVFRLLEKGGPEAVDWLRTHVSDPEIREVITSRKGRGIDPERLRYWQFVLNLPSEDVDAWVQRALKSPWHNR